MSANFNDKYNYSHDNILDGILNNNLDFDKNENDKNRPISNVHIRIQQRNGRKRLTIIEGLANDLDTRKILKYLKKSLNTNGSVLTDNNGNEIIQLQGDKKDEIVSFLKKYKVVDENDPEIIIHGA
jgi:translation initiation factor 1